MIIDDRLEFCDAQVLNTGGAATYNIGDVIDTRSAAIDPNVLKDHEGAEMYLVVRVTTAATSAGSATLQIRLVSDDTATPNTSTATVHATSPVIPVASLTAGSTVMVTKMPSGNYERFIGVQQITGTAAFTAGAVDAFLVSDPTIWRAYADNVA